MGLFDIVVNLIESMLLTYFVFKCHKLTYDKQYTFITAIIFVEEMISSYIDSQNRVILFVIPMTLMIYQWIRYRKFSINYLLIGVMSALFVSFSNVISFLIVRVVFRLDLIDYLVLGIIQAKIICYILMRYCGKHINVSDSQVPHIWQFNLVVALLIGIMDIDIQSIVFEGDSSIYVYIRIIIISSLVLLLYRFLNQFIESANQRIYYELELQKAEYEKKNTKIMEKNREEILKLDHNLKYTLMTIKFHAQHNDLEAIKEHVDSYLGKVRMVNHAIATKNPYFDYVFNEVSHEYKLNKIILKKNISISENSPINNSFVADKIVNTTKKILDLALSNDITTVDIKISEDGEDCFIHFVFHCEDYNLVSKYINDNFNNDFYCDYDKEFKVAKVSLVVDFE